MKVQPTPPPGIGVRIAGTGMALPQKLLTNLDLESMMDTSDEWIVQRTGIRERRIINRDAGESTTSLSVGALQAALEDARQDASELDFIIVSTVTQEMFCPPTACRVAAEVGAGQIGAMDLSAACCGFVFGINHAYSLVRSGMYRNVALIGADTLSSFVDYNTYGRGTAILFGDAAAAVILRATDDRSKGMIAHAMHSDGARWGELYAPRTRHDFPEGVEFDERMLNRLQMNGRSVFKFAVGTFGDVIQETLDRAGLRAEDVAHYISHQSNARILQAARDRFGLREDQLYINIDRYGNTVAASVPLCLHELRAKGAIREGDLVMFVAFGGGLTWGTSLWRV